MRWGQRCFGNWEKFPARAKALKGCRLHPTACPSREHAVVHPCNHINQTKPTKHARANVRAVCTFTHATNCKHSHSYCDVCHVVMVSQGTCVGPRGVVISWKLQNAAVPPAAPRTKRAWSSRLHAFTRPARVHKAPPPPHTASTPVGGASRVGNDTPVPRLGAVGGSSHNTNHSGPLTSKASCGLIGYK